MAEFGWAYVSGSNLPQGVDKAVQVKKADEFTGSVNFTYDTVTNDMVLSGTAHFSASSHPLRVEGLQQGDKRDDNSYLALDSDGRIILTSSLTTTQTTQISSGGGGGSGNGTIGSAEDGTYADGLFTDFATSTPVGTAVDRFNEVLKIIAPSPAPSLQTIRADETDGVSAKLSFGSISGYTGVGSLLYASGGSPVAGTIFPAVSQNQIYSVTSSIITDADNSWQNATHFQLGIYNNQEITGTINYTISENSTNGHLSYASGAFGNADAGTLQLYIQNYPNLSSIAHSVDLSTFSGSGVPGSGSASSLNSSGSGFIFISETASSFDGNGSEWYLFKHRTVKFKVSPADQTSGSVLVQVRHVIGSTTYYSNWIRWVNDPDGASAALSVSNPRIEDVFLTGSKYISGVQYNTDLTASYKADIINMYRNVFPAENDTITFNPTNSITPSAQSVPDISGSEDHTKILGVTASVDYDGTYLLNGTIGMSLDATHPLKADLSNTGSATIAGMLIDADTSTPNSNLSETFEDEDFRISSGSYDTETAASSATWDSTAHMTASGLAGHDDGMLIYNRRLYNPRDGDIPNSGDFSALVNVESGQPDYSSVTGIRTYFRKIQNTTSGEIRDLKITSQKDGIKFNIDTQALDNNDAYFYAKIPGKTGWMNISENFVYGSTSDGDGGLINGATNNSSIIGTGNSVHCVTFGTQSISQNEHVLIKIETNGIQGYVSQLDFQLGASTETAVTPQTLSDIDANNTGQDAKLSFGTSNTIPNYSNATGSSISLTDHNTNDLYDVDHNRRGIFSASVTIDGEINETFSSYPAKSFYNAYSGSLILEVNGQEVHSASLSSTLNAIDTTNGNGSRLNISAVSFSTTSDNIPDYRRPYRTGTYEIDSADQNVGWNYARLIHRTSADAVTNYVEWIVDPSGSTDDTSVSTPTLSDFNHSDVYYQSGIGYFASRPSASFSYTADNFYRNVYQNGISITFPTTDSCSISNIRVTGSGVHTTSSAVSSLDMPLLNNTTDCEETQIEITGTVLFDSLTSISGGLSLFTHHDVTVDGQVLHPFKSDRTTSTASKTSFMVFSGSNTSNQNTNEYFTSEDYRIVSGNYVNQAAVTSSSNTWDSTVSINDTSGNPNHSDGLVTVNGYAVSPLQIGNAGDTRNDNEGSTGLQAPAGNPNYSNTGLSVSERTFYRYFRNTSGVLVTSPSITLFGDATIVAANGSVGANNNIKIELKVPSDPVYTGSNDKSTGWCDVGSPLDDQQDLTVDGAGLYTSTLDTNIDTDGAQVNLGFQSKGIYNNQYFVVKITVHKDWTGYLSEIRMAY